MGRVYIDTDNEAQDRVAQKLEALIVGMTPSRLMDVRTMGQGLIEQRNVVERIPQMGLQNRQEGRTFGGDHSDSTYFLKTTQAFVPPKPNEVDIATCTGVARATFGT